MTSEAHPATSADPARSAWRRAVNIAIVVGLVIASVGAQAVDLTPVAIVLLVAAICALAPLFAPTVEA
jgi:hypothetical protein